MKKCLYTLFFFFVFTFESPAQFIVSPNCDSAYEDILSLRFEAANRFLTTDKNTNPGNQYVVYLENYKDFLSVFISEDEGLYELYLDKKNGRIDLLKEIDDKSPYKNYLLGNVFMQSAFIEIKFADYVAAALDFNRAYRLIEDNAKEFPGFLPNQISMGVLSIMVGLVPENYRWFLNLLSIEGRPSTPISSRIGMPVIRIAAIVAPTTAQAGVAEYRPFKAGDVLKFHCLYGHNYFNIQVIFKEAGLKLFLQIKKNSLVVVDGGWTCSPQSNELQHSRLRQVCQQLKISARVK